MILFFISFLLVFISSYLVTSVIAPKKSIVGFIYLFVIAFAQLVLTFEVLSLFDAIKPFYVLGMNFLFLLTSGVIWYKNSKPTWSLDCKDFRNRVINSFKLDKSLMWLYVGFWVLLLSALFLCLIMPITNMDAIAYHVARSLFWVINGNLNHFETADIRNLCLPINSEILYAWVLLFIKKEAFLGFFSFVGYLLSIVSIYNILGYLGYCTRKKLWVIFILSSFSSVIVQISGTETDMIIAGLVSSSLFLFWYALKNNKTTPIFMASLAYALAIGTKTTSIIAIPGIGLFLLALSIYFKKKEFYKPLSYFVGFGLLNFLIFASYNYILNYIQFANPMGAESLMQSTKNYYGLKAIPANFIKYLFMFFDFTGFRWSDYVGPSILHFRDSILNLLHLADIPNGIYTTNGRLNRSLIEPMIGAGILGFLVYVPCLVWSLIKPILRPKSKKTLFVFGFGFLLIVNLLVMSYLLSYMAFSVRFVMTFIVLSSPILIYSYLSNKNPLKYIIIAFSLFYLMGVSIHLWARPVNKIIPLLMDNTSITELREMAAYKDMRKDSLHVDSSRTLSNEIKSHLDKSNKILIFMNTSSNIYSIRKLSFDGYNIDFGNLENIRNINLSKYNLIITTNHGQTSTVINDYEKRKNEYKLENYKVTFFNKNNMAPCVYIPNPSAPKSKNGEKIPPFQSQCFISDIFLNKNHLELIGTAGSISSHDKDPEYFVLYQNTKLSLKMKKKITRH